MSSKLLVNGGSQTLLVPRGSVVAAAAPVVGRRPTSRATSATRITELRRVRPSGTSMPIPILESEVFGTERPDVTMSARP
jgi:hypothetical protein